MSEETGQWIESRAGEAAFDADNLHAHAAAVTAAKDAEIAQLRADNTRLQNEVVMPLRERVRVLEDALRMALAELDELPGWSNTGHICNAARAALGDKTPNDGAKRRP